MEPTRLSSRAMMSPSRAAQATEAFRAIGPARLPIVASRACFGSTSDPALRSFYAEGVLATVMFTGRGECRTAKEDYPEPGMRVVRCFLELRDLPSGYVGGHLTTNTMGSRNEPGEETDPPGYTQPSIATIRLWKRR